MSDLKTFFDRPAADTPGLGGDSVVARGTDPLTDTGGSSALKTFFDQPIDPSLEGSETPNSLSGLPAQPCRFEPSESSVEPPDLTNRNLGTVDRG